MNQIRIQISAPLFWGYGMEMTKATLDETSDADVLAALKVSLLDYLNDANMVELAAKAKELTLHLDRHCGTGEAAKDGTPIVYACDHHHEHF